MEKRIKATLMLSGMVTGVGMFAIPFSFSIAGFWLGAFELVTLAFVVLFIHLSYAEIVLHTREHHRLPGYVQRYLGDGAARVADVSTFVGIAGTLLAYVLLGGLFLDGLVKGLMSTSNPMFWSFMLIAVGGAVTLFPIKKSAIITSTMTALLIGLLIFLVGLLLPRFVAENLRGFHLPSVFAPYGVLLFALWGTTVIPDVVSLLRGERTHTRGVVIAGSLIPAVLYFCFAFAVIGASNGNVSPDAIAGLFPVVGPVVVLLGNVIGLLAVTKAYMILNSSFQAFLTLDLNVSRRLAWAGGLFLPIFLILLGFQNFITVISVVGATTVAIDGGLILATYHMILHKRERAITSMDTLRFGLLYTVMIAGIGYELYYFVSAYVV